MSYARFPREQVLYTAERVGALIEQDRRTNFEKFLRENFVDIKKPGLLARWFGARKFDTIEEAEAYVNDYDGTAFPEIYRARFRSESAYEDQLKVCRDLYNMCFCSPTAFVYVSAKDFEKIEDFYYNDWIKDDENVGNEPEENSGS